MKGIFHLLVISILLFSCVNPEKKSKMIHLQGEALGTTYSIQYEGEENYGDEFNAVFNRMNASMSTYIPSSDISRINRGEVVTVDSLFINVLQASREIWKKTDGAFDPTVGPLVNFYGFGPTERSRLIDSAKVDSLLTLVGLSKVTVSPEGELIKEDQRIFLDFNAIAKGYTLDLLGKVLGEKGVENYLIELGGELLAKGKNAEKDKPWVVAIDDPRQTDTREFIKKIKLENAAMATSGNYRKFILDTVTGSKYVHSIDPVTGWPKKSNVLSVSVIAENCMLADGYATAFMVMDMDRSKKVLDAEPALDAYIIYLDDKGELKEFQTLGFTARILQ